MPYYWYRAMAGEADSDNGRVAKFKITKEDRELWPELPKRRRMIRLVEQDNGFVIEL